MKHFLALFFFLCLYMVFTIADISFPVPYQSTCDITNASPCSSSTLCQCETVATGEKVCTQQMSCDYAATCNATDHCEKENSTCVVDSRCPGKRLCYSVVLFSPELCPPPVSNVTTVAADPAEM